MNTLADLEAATWKAFVDFVTPKPCPWATPGEMAMALDARTVQTAALKLIDQKLVDVAEGRCERLIISMPPQEGKSQRVSRRFPLWMLRRNPNLRIAIASYEFRIARRWGRDIRNDIITHSGQLGLAIRPDTAAAHEWQLAGHNGGVITVGIGGPITGRPVDLLIIDDPIKGRKEADSEIIREACWDWWLNNARTRLPPGAPVVLIMTRWHEDDLAGRLLRHDEDSWELLNIPAQADHRPERGETDPLGREPGEYLVSTRGRHRINSPGKCHRKHNPPLPNGCCDWDDIKHDVGSRVWNSLYQGKPAPTEGTIFQRNWFQRYEHPQWIVRPDGSHWATTFDEIIMSWDMTFKDTKGSDYVCGQVWGRRGVDAYLLDLVHDHLSFVDTCTKVRELAAKWPQAVLKLVEDKANGPAVIDALSRTVPGLVPVEPRGSKVARAAAVSPFVEGRNVYLPAPELAPWVGKLVDELCAFPYAAHDDQVDALSQALDRLLLSPLLSEQEVIVDPEHDDYRVSRY